MRRPWVDGPIGGGPVGDVRVLLLDGPRAGEEVDAFVAGRSTAVSADDFEIGDEVVVSFRGQPSGEAFVSVVDRWRLPILALLAAAFITAIALVGGARGVRALLALALTIALVIKVVVPQLIQGVPPIPLVLVVATIVTVASIGLTEGLGRTSAAAIAGTVAAVGLTGVLAAVVSELGRFSAAAGEELVFLQVSG